MMITIHENEIGSKKMKVILGMMGKTDLCASQTGYKIYRRFGRVHKR